MGKIPEAAEIFEDAPFGLAGGGIFRNERLARFLRFNSNVKSIGYRGDFLGLTKILEDGMKGPSGGSIDKDLEKLIYE